MRSRPPRSPNPPHTSREFQNSTVGPARSKGPSGPNRRLIPVDFIVVGQEGIETCMVVHRRMAAPGRIVPPHMIVRAGGAVPPDVSIVPRAVRCLVERTSRAVVRVVDEETSIRGGPVASEIEDGENWDGEGRGLVGRLEGRDDPAGPRRLEDAAAADAAPPSAAAAEGTSAMPSSDEGGRGRR